MSYRTTSRSSAGSSYNQKKSTNEKNQKILRDLVKDPANKVCADCKTSGHPRWTSWSLGIFICIRCSGIHRGMGTHISKVRSIDLDTWSDEQIDPLLKWGNKRANLYWEAKLPANYVPDDSKIENYIRTKYDLKKWRLSSHIPDPSTLSDSSTSNGVPAKIESNPAHSSVTRQGSASRPGRQAKLGGGTGFIDSPSGPTRKPSIPSRYNGNNRSASFGNRDKPTPSIPQQQPQQKQQPSDSLIGLDFGAPSTTVSNAVSSPTSVTQPSATSSGVNMTTQNSKPDLKSSILSLYSTVPVSQATYQQQSQTQNVPFTNNTGFDSSLVSLTGNLSLGTSTSTSSVSRNQQQSNLFANESTAVNNSNGFDNLLAGGTLGWDSFKPIQKAPADNSFSLNSHFSSSDADEWADFKTAEPGPTNAVQHDAFKDLWH